MRTLYLDIETLEERVLNKTRPGAGGCLEWAHATARGYGTIMHKGKNVGVHRIACLALHGLPPEGKTHALHRCGNRRCVNPFHLYWGDNADNARDRKNDGVATGGRVYATACIHGHPFDEGNTYRTAKGRHCKECRREAVRRYRSRSA